MKVFEELELLGHKVVDYYSKSTSLSSSGFNTFFCEECQYCFWMAELSFINYGKKTYFYAPWSKKFGIVEWNSSELISSFPSCEELIIKDIIE